MFRLAAVAVSLVLSASPLYAQETLFTVTVTFANIHAGPSIYSPVIATAPPGRTFKVARELGSWVAIQWPASGDGLGYLHTRWGSFSREGAADAGGAVDAPLTAAQPVAESVPAQGSAPVQEPPETVARGDEPAIAEDAARPAQGAAGQAASTQKPSDDASVPASDRRAPGASDGQEAREQARHVLPKTASLLPLALMLGLGAIAGGLWLRRRTC